MNPSYSPKVDHTYHDVLTNPIRSNTYDVMKTSTFHVVSRLTGTTTAVLAVMCYIYELTARYAPFPNLPLSSNLLSAVVRCLHLLVSLGYLQD